MFNNFNNLQAAAPPHIQALVDDAIENNPLWAIPWLEYPETETVLVDTRHGLHIYSARQWYMDLMRKAEAELAKERYGTGPVDFGNYKSLPLVFAWTVAYWGPDKHELTLAAADMRQRQEIMRLLNKDPELRAYLVAKLQLNALRMVHKKSEARIARAKRAQHH